MKKRPVVSRTRMQSACMAAIKKGRGPIAKRRMAKLGQPTDIGN